MKSITLLLEDHQQMLRAVEIMEEMLIRARHGQKPDIQDLNEILAFLDGFGDRIHQAREEGVLFPALLRDPGQANYPKLSSLRFEHDRHRSLIEGLQKACAVEDLESFCSCCARLTAILRDHIQDEETNLFPLVTSVLSTADDEQIARDMQGYDSIWQSEKLPQLARRLGELELKYLGKAHVDARALRTNTPRQE